MTALAEPPAPGDPTLGELAAARAMNASLLREYQGLAKELDLLRARYEELARALAETRAECEEVRAQAAALADDGVSPASLAVARRLTGLSARHPKAAAAAKTALRKGLEVKRNLSDRS